MTTNQRDMSASVAAAFLENQDPRLGLMFVCRCGASFQQLTELVNHYEDKHNRPALAPYIPAKFQKEA